LDLVSTSAAADRQSAAADRQSAVGVGGGSGSSAARDDGLGLLLSDTRVAARARGTAEPASPVLLDELKQAIRHELASLQSQRHSAAPRSQSDEDLPRTSSLAAVPASGAAARPAGQGPIPDGLKQPLSARVSSKERAAAAAAAGTVSPADITPIARPAGKSLREVLLHAYLTTLEVR